MIGYLQHRSNRWGYDGWALRIHGAPSPLPWTASTTRAEARELRKSRADLFEHGAEIVKVRVVVEVVS